MPAPVTIKPYRINIPDATLTDLKARLQNARWPEKEPVNDWSQGVPLSVIRDLCEYWQHGYDWRKCEQWLNDVGQYMADIEIEVNHSEDVKNQDHKCEQYQIHFLHIRSRYENALPLLLLHGWPGSIFEFRKAIGPLTEGSKLPSSPISLASASAPSAVSNDGGSAGNDAFHLIIPSMPGFGFSKRPSRTGTGYQRMAMVYTRLMAALGYDHWVAQGGDFGSDICTSLAAVENDPPPSLAAIHVNVLFFDAHKEIATSSSERIFPGSSTEADNERRAGEELALARQNAFEESEYGYFKEQATRPQTIGYSLADSPVGQAAWIYEKLHSWSQHAPDVASPFTQDEILDNIMMYWLSNTAASSARLYWEEKVDNNALKIDIPVGVTNFPAETVYAPRHWAERYYSNIIYWADADKGGHFAAWEVPDVFVHELQDCFRQVRRTYESAQ